jgi:hypothetical protein
MKNITKKYLKTIPIYGAFMLFCLSSCYKENTIMPDLLQESKGKIAYIATFWAGTNPLTKITTISAAAGSNVACNVEYTTETPVKDIKLFVANTTTVLETVPVGSAKWDAKLRNYVVVFNVKAAATKGGRVQVQAEIESTNGLLSNRRLITINSI